MNKKTDFISESRLIEKTRNRLNAVYKQGIEPWFSSFPDDHVIDFLRNFGKQTANNLKLLDIGCGATARHALYAAKQGFEVSAIDTSDVALERAAEATKTHQNKIRLIQLDVQHELNLLPQNSFDCILEWSFLHHIKTEEREDYVDVVSQLLPRDGQYFTSCFSTKGNEWGKIGDKIRVDERTGAKLYFSSREELNALYGKYFKIINYELSPIRYEGSLDIPHLYHIYTLEKK